MRNRHQHTTSQVDNPFKIFLKLLRTCPKRERLSDSCMFCFQAGWTCWWFPIPLQRSHFPVFNRHNLADSVSSHLGVTRVSCSCFLLFLLSSYKGHKSCHQWKTETYFSNLLSSNGHPPFLQAHKCQTALCTKKYKPLSLYRYWSFSKEKPRKYPRTVRGSILHEASSCSQVSLSFSFSLSLSLVPSLPPNLLIWTAFPRFSRAHALYQTIEQVKNLFPLQDTVVLIQTYCWLFLTVFNLIVVLVGAARVNDMVNVLHCFSQTLSFRYFNWCSKIFFAGMDFWFQAHAPFELLHDLNFDDEANTRKFQVQVLSVSAEPFWL